GPGLAGIGRLVDARVFAGPGAEQVRRGVAERLDIAEVEFLRSSDRADGPSLPAVGRASECSLGPADPRQLRADGAQPAPVRVGGDFLPLPLGVDDRIPK